MTNYQYPITRVCPLQVSDYTGILSMTQPQVHCLAVTSWRVDVPDQLIDAFSCSENHLLFTTFDVCNQGSGLHRSKHNAVVVFTQSSGAVASIGRCSNLAWLAISSRGNLLQVGKCVSISRSIA
jgi:hypothetical protein